MGVGQKTIVMKKKEDWEKNSGLRKLESFLIKTEKKALESEKKSGLKNWRKWGVAEKGSQIAPRLIDNNMNELEGTFCFAVVDTVASPVLHNRYGEQRK
ncbi:hypothetical protein JTE90_020524 [Oedothorax gibbosus]|uniref:Uncharacterized protein n=1 Tax=Oedothorax gibbosus TaxID=931172 RepID=A0AAV6VWB0_9ARAC|nr:hypothetical protein JTE90_020524 [Oedothorax gibbosus]